MHPSVKNQGEWKSWCQRRFPVSGWSWVILSSSWWARCTGWSKIYWQGPLWCCRAFGPASVLVKFKMWIRQLKLFWVHIRTPQGQIASKKTAKKGNKANKLDFAIPVCVLPIGILDPRNVFNAVVLWICWFWCLWWFWWGRLEMGVGLRLDRRQERRQVMEVGLRSSRYLLTASDYTIISTSLSN